MFRDDDASSVSVVIVAFHNARDVEQCLESCARDLKGLVWDAVVVDNGQTLGAQSVRAEAAVRTIPNSTNVGFARAVNQALAVARGRLIWLVNPDCLIRPGAFTALRAVLDSDDATAVVGPRVLNSDGTLQGTARGDPTWLTGLFGRSTILSRLFPRSGIVRRHVKLHLTPAEGSHPTEVAWLSGACLLFRRTALEAVGGFDERYFLYWEDADVCRRLRGQGATVRYVPTAVVEHAQGRSTRLVPRLAIRAFHESAYVYYTTHVVPRRWHPGRPLAASVLAVRCWWKSRPFPSHDA